MKKLSSNYRQTSVRWHISTVAAVDKWLVAKGYPPKSVNDIVRHCLNAVRAMATSVPFMTAEQAEAHLTQRGLINRSPQERAVSPTDDDVIAICHHMENPISVALSDLDIGLWAEAQAGDNKEEIEE